MSKTKKSKQIQNYQNKKERLKTQVNLLSQLAELSQKNPKSQEQLSQYVSPISFFNQKNKNSKKRNRQSSKSTLQMHINENDLKTALRKSKQKERTMENNKLLENEKSSDEESIKTDDMSTEPEDLELDASEIVSGKDKSMPNLSSKQEAEQKISQKSIHKSLKSVIVTRSKKIQESRLDLPILSEEFEILDHIRNNVFIIVSGATGSGKTTQIPQFLYEAGYAEHGMIGITEPRRVAATSIAKRVGEELCNHSNVVGHQVKFDNQTTDNTKIKFMTDGILIQEMKGDFMLSKYSVIIIDEAHERSIFTDVLLGLLSRVAIKRNETANPLKVIIMSATLYMLEFVQNQKLFKDFQPPIIEIESRQFKNVIHYSKQTPDDYIKAAFKKVCKINDLLPNGTILVFVTSKNEVHELCDMISSYSEATSSSSIKPLPFHSMLNPEKQAQVFECPNSLEQRICVVATNIAETSITIPNVRYVIDCGKVKIKHYNILTEVEYFEVDWISKASAAQRAGRAGRVCEGHVYRLYSHALYGGMAEHSKPEILKYPLSQIVLQLKCLGVHKIENFPFPTSPSLDAIKTAENELSSLGLLDSNTDKDGFKVLTINDQGKAASMLPVSPKFAKIIIKSLVYSQNVIYWIVSIVACFSVSEIFIDKQSQIRFNSIFKPQNQIQTDAGDLMTYINVIGSVLHEKSSLSKFSINRKAFNEIKLLQQSFFQLINENWCHKTIDLHALPDPPSNNQILAIVNCFASASFSCLAFKVFNECNTTNNVTNNNQKKIIKSKINSKKFSYQSIQNEDDLFQIHETSPLKLQSPQIVSYISKISTNDDKVYMIGCFTVTPYMLYNNFESFCYSIDKTNISNLIIGNDQSIKTFYHLGKIMYWNEFEFGPRRWNIGKTLIPLKDGMTLFLRFALHLISLDLFETESKNPKNNLVKKLKDKNYQHKNTNVLTLKYFKSHQHSKKLILKLIENDVFDKNSFSKALSSNTSFLMEEFASWYPDESYQLIQECWPHISLK